MDKIYKGTDLKMLLTSRGTSPTDITRVMFELYTDDKSFISIDSSDSDADNDGCKIVINESGVYILVPSNIIDLLSEGILMYNTTVEKNDPIFGSIKQKSFGSLDLILMPV